MMSDEYRDRLAREVIKILEVRAKETIEDLQEDMKMGDEIADCEEEIEATREWLLREIRSAREAEVGTLINMVVLSFPGGYQRSDSTFEEKIFVLLVKVACNGSENHSSNIERKASGLF